VPPRTPLTTRLRELKKKKKRGRKKAKRNDGRWEQGTQGVLATRNPSQST
jgi:hypothetical protein